MKIGVLGTGSVGTTIGSKLVALGHEVRMGARSAGNEKAQAWAKQAGGNASAGSFADAASFGEILFNCTLGSGSLEALEQAGERNLAGQVLVDVSNPLDFSKGMPPSLTVCNTDSLGEQLQRAFPSAKVVKALNHMSAALMVQPSLIEGEHDVLIAGNDAGAKGEVARLLREWFGWKSVIDLGNITAARGLEGYTLLWGRLWGALQTGDFNIKIMRR